MPIPTLNDVRHIKDPAPLWRWVATLPSITGSNISENRVSLVEAVSVSHSKIGVDDRFHSGTYSNYPKFVNYDTVELSFYETKDYDITKYLYAWKKLIVDVSNSSTFGNFSLPSTYKKTIIVDAYGWSSNDSPNMIFELIGAWPTNITPYQYNYSEESNRLIVNATFAIDKSVITQNQTIAT